MTRPEQWRGAHCVRELLTGNHAVGNLDRSHQHPSTRWLPSRHRCSTVRLHRDPALSAMPCFAGMDDAGQREWDTRLRRCDRGGARDRKSRRHASRRQRQHSQSDARRDSIRSSADEAHSPRPGFTSPAQTGHVSCRVTYTLFVAIYRSAAEKLKRGSTQFSLKGVPPARPYVPLQGVSS